MTFTACLEKIHLMKLIDLASERLIYKYVYILLDFNSRSGIVRPRALNPQCIPFV